MMKPIKVQKEGEEITIGCLQWKNFPPKWALVPDKTPEGLRSEGLLDEAEYQRYKTWQRLCGITAMEPTKCLSCPLCRKVEFRVREPHLVSFDGKQVTKVTDMAQAGSRLHYPKQTPKVPR